jgi:hypothetical protein
MPGLDPSSLSVHERNQPRPKPILLNYEFISGQNGDFHLYEDENDNYDYEYRAYSVIPMHWTGLDY